MGAGSAARRNAALFTLYSIGQNAPLYWPYMFHLVTVVRGLSPTEFGALKGLYYGATVALEVPMGAVADRFGRRVTLLLSALLNALACAMYAVASDFALFAAAELVFAVCNALHSGADSALLYDSLAAEGREADYARSYGRARASSYLTLVIGLPLTDLWLVRAGDPAPAYLATALLALLGAGAAFAMREPPRLHGRSTFALAGSALRAVGRDRLLLVLILYGTGVYMLYRSANAAYYNPVLAWKGVSVERFGSLYAVVSACGALAAWRAHALRARLGDRALVVAMPCAVLAMYAGLALVPGSAVVLLFAIEGTVGGLFPVVAHDLVNRRVDDSSHRATLLSLVSFAWRGSYALASVWIGWTLDVFALPGALPLGVLACALPLVAALALRDPPRRRP
jgi:predicted MFS family arabinose efflux permease